MASIDPIQLQKVLKGVDYPASKQDLLRHAREQGADEPTLRTLEQLPEQQYQTPADVSQAAGKLD